MKSLLRSKIVHIIVHSPKALEELFGVENVQTQRCHISIPILLGEGQGDMLE